MPTPTPTPPRIVVLLVDDQPIIGEAVRRMLLADPEITLHYCQDPLAAVATAERLAPTVILQDLVMPGMDGLTLVQRFRDCPATRDTPLVVLSTKEDPKIKEEAFTLGANDYLVKLPHAREMLARIRYHSRAHTLRLERDEAFRRLEAHGKFIRETFGRYLSDEIVASLLESPTGLSLGGEKRRVTILMGDLRGFTALTETLPPEKVVALINNYLEGMTEVILAHGGTIDEILGDALLVIFGAPILREDDARRAVACALEMQLAMAQVNEKNHQDGLPTLEMGIGINTGDVVCGNIGSRRRAKYGIVGAHVNLTSRIESYTVGGQILVSEATLAAAGADVRVDGHLEVTPKGVRRPITLHEVGAIGAPFSLALPWRDGTLLPLAAPLAARYSMIEGKQLAGERYPCRVLAVSEIGAELAAERPPRTFTDVQVELVDAAGQPLAAAIYGKVVPREAPAPDGAPAPFVVRFTSLPADAKARLRPTAG